MQLKTAVIAAMLLSSSAFVVAEEKHHWGYSGEGAPKNWGKLDPAFVTCATGKAQSPINVTQSAKGDAKAIAFDYKSGAAEILNNGHTVQVNYAPGSTITIDGRAYELKQFHFHAPSENTINGKHFPLEGHLVHQDKDGKLAVVAIMFRDGAANPLIASLWKQMPAKEGEKHALAAPLNAVELLPAERHYYRFEGSLTTPPCSEGVSWLVVTTPVSASKAQVATFAKAMGHANNRPVQPLNSRAVLLQ
jgi:carbonic anhydrase